MQGSGISSQSIWTAFDTMTTATARILKFVVRVAWKRATTTSGFFTIGTSLIGGEDILQGQEGNIVKPDLFQYTDETDNAVRLEYDREILEPLGGMALAQADVLLDNTGLRFTPNQNNTIGTAILPNRPLSLYMGFQVQGQVKNLAVFRGLTDMPREDKISRLCRIHCYDYLKFLNQLPLESTIYTSQRSDQIISDILTTAGFGATQFVLDTGLNTIGFAWFQKGSTAGDRIRRICEAEEGFFYQDENGILRFENRRHFSVSPHDGVVWTIEPDDILEWQEDYATSIINKCIVRAKPREVQSETEIWRHGIVEEIPGNGSVTIWASFDNPASAITTQVATTDYLANSQSDGSGSDDTSNISIVISKFTTSAKMVITNSGAKTFLRLLRLRGTPAVVTTEIEEHYQDNDSVTKYEEHQYEIDNDYIDNRSFAYYLARAIVRKYKDPTRRIVIRVRAIPQLQLRDKVKVKDRDLGTYKEYRVMGIKGTMDTGEFYQSLTLREVSGAEADSWFTIGTSTIESQTDFIGV